MDDGPDGASHHALEDLALTRVLPGLTILTPADAEEIADAFEQAAKIKGPVYIRVAREPMPVRDKSVIPGSPISRLSPAAATSSPFSLRARCWNRPAKAMKSWLPAAKRQAHPRGDAQTV
jgi:transketolase